MNTQELAHIYIGNKFRFLEHVQNPIKKVNKKLYCIRIMNTFHVSTNVIVLFCNATIALNYASTGFYDGTPAAFAKGSNGPKKSLKNQLVNRV